MRLSSDKDIALLILGGLAVTLVLLQLFFAGTYDAGDSLMHFQIARHAPLHPHLYLDLWGKPTFTLLASPLAIWG